MKPSTRLLPLLLCAACSTTPQTPKYDGSGGFAVGVHTYTFVDSSRPTPVNGSYAGAPDRTLVTEVWYPATGDASAIETDTRDATAAAGSFPLVVHSHGFMDNRNGEIYLARHLASHGYIVAAPDFPLSNGGAPGGPTVLDLPNQPGDVSFVIDQVIANLSVDSTHIGVSGLSLGGITTLLSAFHARWRDSRVGAALSMAGVSCMLTQPFFSRSLPVLFLQGDADLIAPPEDNSERSFPLAQDPRELVLLKAGSHTGFAGIASLLDPTMNYDRIGCSALGNITVTSFSGLGTADEGISQDPSVCPEPCQGTPVDPSLDATRQQEVTKTVAEAFFDGWLLGDAGAKKFLQGALASENHEVKTQLK